MAIAIAIAGSLALLCWGCSRLALSDDLPSQESLPPRLDYAAPPSRWRRRIRRSLILLAVVAAVWSACWRGPALWRNAHILYWQRQCLNYTASPQQVVYEEEPSAVQQLLAADSQYTLQPSSGTPGTQSGSGQPARPAVFAPRCWRNFTTPPRGVRVMSFGGSGAVVFLHELRSPNGTRYLVEVEYARPMDGFQPSWVFGDSYFANAIIPGTLTTPPIPPNLPYAIDVPYSWPKLPPNVRIYAGQLDPADPSHFTIRYEMWGKSDTVDGRVDDSGKVQLQQRHVPEWPR